MRGHGGQRHGEPGDLRARLGHLKEAIEHLRAAGINEPAEHLEKMARGMAENMERQQKHHAGGPHESPRHSFIPPSTGGRPPMAMHGMEEMQKELRSLAGQVQELRRMVQSRGGNQEHSARQQEGPRDGDRRAAGSDGPPRRPDGPPQAENKSREGDHDGPPRSKPQGESGKPSSRDGAPRSAAPQDSPPRGDAQRDGGPRGDAPRDGAQRGGGPRDGAVREGAPHDGPPRGDTKRDAAPRNEGAKAEPSGFSRPSDLDRGRFLALSERAREKLAQEMRENRDRMMKATPEERMKFAKELFERVEAGDKAKSSESGSADDALRALSVKPPL